MGEAAVRHNDEDFGPFGESRDEDVGPFGESREENVGPFGDVRDDLGGKMDNLMDFATRCLDQMYRKSSTNGATSYSTDHAGTNEVNTSDLWSGSATAPTVTQPAQDIAQSLVSKDGTPQSTTVKISNGFQGSAATNINITHTQPSTRKRLRDHSEVPDGKDLNPRANRIRIGAMNCNGPDIPTTSGNARTEFPRLLAAIPKVSKKRGREDSGDLDQDGMVSKRLRNSEWARKNEGVNNEHPKTYEGHTPSYVDSTSIDDHSTGKKNHEAAVICKASDTTIFQEAETADENHVENATTNTDNTTALAIAEWGTAHVFNSKGADIYFPRKVNTIDGNLERMRLPRPAKSGDGDWTTEDDEDIHSWIQDYGVRDWKRVAQATNRSEEERQARYLHMVTSRNIQAGRVPNDGVPERYPDLSPPLPGAPPPAISDRVLRPRNRRAGPGVSKIACGELTYDLKARKFPRLAKNGNLVDSHGNTILGIEGDIPFVTKPKTQGRKRKRKQKLRLTHLSPPPATCQVLL